jgi:hypothetical protein
MSDTTANLALPYIMAAQAQKHVTHNEALRILDGLVQLSVLERNPTAPPGSPANGERYIVGWGATGDWAGWDGDVAAWVDGAWFRLIPKPGWRAWVESEQALWAYDGTMWQLLAFADPPRFKAYPTADTPVAVDTWVTLPLTQTEFNARGRFDTVAYRFTASLAGTYTFGAKLLYKVATSTTARMRGRLLLNGTTEIRGSFAEVSGGHTSGSTTLGLQAVAELSLGDTVELQAGFRVADGIIASDHTCFWGRHIG